MLEEEDLDARLRASAMVWLRAELLRTPQGIRHDRLTEFRFEGTRVPLLNLQRGIWKPAILNAALTIRTVFRNKADERPYDDAPGPEGLLRYKWMGFDANASDNRAVRRAMEQRVPLIYLVGIAKGLYQPVFPVFIEAEGSAAGLVDISYARRARAGRMSPCPRSSLRSSSVMSRTSRVAVT